MAEYVVGLSGGEIITDILDQIEKRLRRDCNLRDSDSYGRGYLGKITIHLELQAMDTAQIDVEEVLKPSPDLPIGTEEFSVEGVKDVVVDETIEIPLESDLTAVRDRSDQPIPIQTLDPTTGKPEIKRRSYLRKAAIGNAVDVT